MAKERDTGRNIEQTFEDVCDDEYSSFPPNMREELRKEDKASERASRGIDPSGKRESLYK